MEQKRVRTEEALRASDERFQIAIKHAPLIVFNHDTDLRYTWIHNPVPGLRVEDVIGKRDDELLPDVDALPLMQIKRSVIETGVSARQEVMIDHAGKRYYYDLSIEPLRDEAGTIAGITCAAVDISEIKQVESQLRQANQLKDEFLATVSHELRTPLNSILGWALMLRRHRLDEASTKRAIEIIEHSARIQAQLIEDLLDVSRIVSGKLRLDAKTMELTSVIQSAIDSMRHAAEAKQINIELIQDASPGEIIGDATRIQQVIWNLLSNAVKFTPIGGRVQVKAERNGTNMRVTVTDNGEGISPEFVPYVFDRFQQADGTITRRHGGLGLGLAIVRHLVEMHGGTIAAHSDGLGKGATFQVDFPLHDPGDVPRPAMIPVDNVWQAADDINNQILAGLKILIVDDESNAREMLSTFLSKHGASLTAVASAAEALEAVVKIKPDLLVCDIGMPEEDGYSLIHKVRALPEANGKDIPAIALTGYVRIEERVRALQEGFQMFVAKPVEPDELISSIMTLISVPGERTQN
jgi:PAS domain S-box-containing protein